MYITEESFVILYHNNNGRQIHVVHVYVLIVMNNNQFEINNTN